MTAVTAGPLRTSLFFGRSAIKALPANYTMASQQALVTRVSNAGANPIACRTELHVEADRQAALPRYHYQLFQVVLGERSAA